MLVSSIILFISHKYNKEIQRNKIDSAICTSISDSLNSFSNYSLKPTRSGYIYGISNFYLFKCLYKESDNYNSHFYSISDSAYAKLLFDESLDSCELEILIEALKLLEEDYSDVRGYTNLQYFVGQVSK